MKLIKMDAKTTAFYERLKTQLENHNRWPAEYLFKFVVPADLKKISEIEAIFDRTNAEIKTRDSSKGKYTSLSIKVTLPSADAVIEKYLEVSKVEGVISF